MIRAEGRYAFYTFPLGDKMHVRHRDHYRTICGRRAPHSIYVCDLVANHSLSEICEQCSTVGQRDAKVVIT